MQARLVNSYLWCSKQGLCRFLEQKKSDDFTRGTKGLLRDRRIVVNPINFAFHTGTKDKVRAMPREFPGRV